MKMKKFKFEAHQCRRLVIFELMQFPVNSVPSSVAAFIPTVYRNPFL